MLSFVPALENRLGLLPIHLAHQLRLPQLLQLGQSSRDQGSPMVGVRKVTLDIIYIRFRVVPAILSINVIKNQQPVTRADIYVCSGASSITNLLFD